VGERRGAIDRPVLCLGDSPSEVDRQKEGSPMGGGEEKKEGKGGNFARFRERNSRDTSLHHTSHRRGKRKKQRG